MIHRKSSGRCFKPFVVVQKQLRNDNQIIIIPSLRITISLRVKPMVALHCREIHTITKQGLL